MFGRSLNTLKTKFLGRKEGSVQERKSKNNLEDRKIHIDFWM